MKSHRMLWLSVFVMLMAVVVTPHQAIASPSTAYVYDLNLLPIGQALWLKELESYIPFPPLQNPASYNLEQVIQQVRDMKNSSPAGQ